jgi:hypothetical protein
MLVREFYRISTTGLVLLNQGQSESVDLRDKEKPMDISILIILSSLGLGFVTVLVAYWLDL